jgi:thiol-disulfide isomerase/thioredoxin
MMRLRAHPIRDRLVIAATAVGTAVLLLFLGLEYGPQLVASGEAVRQPVPIAGSVGSVSGNPLDLSVFDQPRAVPEIRFQDGRGDDLTLADFRSRVILLNVWATWCVTCRKEMATLDRLQARLGGKEFHVMALSIDREGVAAVKHFYQEFGVENLAIYVDPSGRGSRALAIPGVPTTLLIDERAARSPEKWVPPSGIVLKSCRWSSGRCMDNPQQRGCRPMSSSGEFAGLVHVLVLGCIQIVHPGVTLHRLFLETSTQPTIPLAGLDQARPGHPRFLSVRRSARRRPGWPEQVRPRGTKGGAFVSSTFV